MKFIPKRLIFLFTALFISFLNYAQLNINNGFTAQQLGNNLAGNNVNVFNANITGDPIQYGTFNYTGNDLGLNSGVILSTGDIFDAVGPNSSGATSTSIGGPGDADLSNLAGFNTNDAVVFDFDFEVQGDEIEFNFIFLSEEYNEFVNSGFNDVFAFYISGPGIVGQENLAIVPGTTTPVTINTINNGSFFQFYNDNENGAVNIEFDGFTTLMTAFKDGLQQCGIYTLSLRIADGSDDQLDSGVLLQENSLVQAGISASSSTFSANNTALEGCIEASFTFQLDSALNQPVSIPIGIGGSATNGVDYTYIDSLITIPPGQTSATLIIDAIADGLPEGQEVVELYYTPSPCQPQDTVFLYIDDYTPLEYEVFPTDITCTGTADGTVDLSVTGGIAPYTLTLTDSITGDQTIHTTFPVTGLDQGTYYVEVIDGYGCSAEDVVAGNLFDAGTTFIPDGQGQSYSSQINLSGFGGTALVQTADQIQSVCATLEHSKIGELLVTLTSPDGTQVILKEQPGGNNTNLGEPCAVGPTDGGQGNTNTDPGIGYNYCWQNISTFGTMVAESGNFTYTYTNICDGSQQSDKYLPSGSYQPYESFDNFIGAQLNGNWTIEVTDNIPNNNGYIFDWSISLMADPPDSIFTINEPAGPTFTHNSVNPDCGGTNGSIDLTVTGGDAPFTFLWSNGAATEDLTGISAGTYSVDVTDANLCIHTYQINLSNNGALIVSGIATNETCVDADNGSVDLTVTGGTAPLNYSWSNSETTEDVFNLAPGSYTVNVSDATGCQGVESFVVGNAPNINISVVITDENCGDQEGIIDITVFGAAAPANYTWSNGDITEDIDELAQGSYIVNIIDANGCNATDTFEVINLVGNCVPECDLAITSSVISDENCGNIDGIINLTVFTTNGPATYAWNNGATAEDLSGLSAGTYDVIITDLEGCEVIEAFTLVNSTGGLSITSINTTNEYCGNGQGAADATVTGGAQPYTYSWNNGATTQDLTAVAAGTYTLTVTDDNGCSVVQTVDIINDAGTLAQTYGNAVDEVCSNGNGSIDIIIEGGQQPYTYNWSNGATTEDLLGLSAGTYSCTITDAGGCSINTPVYTVSNQSGTLAITNVDVDNEVCSNNSGSIEILISGGVAPYSFNWNTGETTQDIFNLSAGTFEATITDDSGCSVSTGNLNLINESGTLNLVGITAFDELCSNGTGSINLDVTGGTAPITYAWSNGSNSEDLTNVSSGNYTVIVTDVNGCSVTGSETVNNDPGVLSIDNVIVTNENCGGMDGALDAIISGAAMPATYTWSNGATTEDLTGLGAGTYTLEVIDLNGCSTSSSAIVSNIANGITVSNSQVTNEICSDGSGSIELNITGGTLPYSYSWSNGATTEDLTGLSAGTFTCTISDNTGCLFVAGPFTVNNSAGGLNVDLASSTDETCSDGSGAIDVTAAGGTAPFTYSWDSGQTTEDISGLNAGTYILTVTDASGCSDQLTVSISNTSGTLAISDITSTDELCSGINGAIDITVSGGTPGYTYAWSNASSTEDLAGISAGTYDVTVTDLNGCTVSSGPIIVNNSAGNFQVTGINVVNENCGDGLGNVDLIVAGASGTVTYTWSNGATTQDLNNVSAGSYSGIATDVAGCTVTFSATVQNDPGIMTVSDIISNTTCGSSNGAIDIIINDGTAPFTFVWSNGATTEDITGLLPGTYICNVTDANGCTVDYTGTVIDEGGPIINSVSSTDESCGNSNGSITLNVSGGTQPYTYSWSGPPVNPCCTYTLDMQDQGNSWNGASIDVFIDGILEGNYTVPGGGANIETFSVCDGENIELVWNQGGFDNEVSFDMLDGSGTVVFSQGGDPTPGTIYTGAATCAGGALDNATETGLSAGTYNVIITDANGCEDSVQVILQNGNGNLQFANTVATDETCSDANGTIDISITGTAPFNYTWSNGATTEDLTGLTAGSYTVDITDPNGCAIQESFVLTNITNGLSISTSSITDENCGDATGAINITAVGGNGPLSYSWSNGFTAEDIFGLNAGTYTVTVSDGSVCDYVESFTVANTSLVALTSIVIDATCGNANGSIDLDIAGGTAPYSIVWSNGQFSEDLSNLASGTYSVTVTDATSCESTSVINVGDSNGGITINGAVTDEFCGNTDGEIDITVNGGTAPYSLQWNNGSTNEDLAGLSQGNYVVTVTDQNGCSETASFNVASDGNFNYTANISNEICNGSNGSVELVFGGFGQPNDFLWSNGATTQNITNVSTGWYTVEMSSNFGPGGGCAMVDSFFVDQNMGSLNIDSLVVLNETCNLADGNINSYISGGTAPYSYSWSNGATTEDIAGLNGGNYTLTATDNSGCITNATATINSYTFGFGIAGASLTNEICGDGTGAIDITVTGGATPYSYSWSNAATTEDLTGLNSGNYDVTVTDAGGCEVSNTFTLGNTTNGFNVSAIVTDETCGDLNGAIDLTTNGGSLPLTFNWSTGATTEDLSGLTGGTYTCTVTDNTGCSIVITEDVISYSANFAMGTPTIVDEDCGDGTGAITVNPTGGTAPLTYSWGSSNPCCTYTLNMYDLNNNGWGGDPIPEVYVYLNGSLYGNFTVPAGNGNSINSVDIPVCDGDVLDFEYVEAAQNQNNTYEVLDGSGTVIFSDGPNPFNGIAFTTTVSCNPGGGNALSGLNAGEYYLEITDAVGCTIADTFTVVNNTGGFGISSSTITDESCEQMNGAIDITPQGATMPITYSWNTGAGAQDVSGLASGNYTITVTDGTGCEVTETYTVSNNGTGVNLVSEAVTDATCATCNDGAIDIEVDPAGAPYTYSWSNASTDEDQVSLFPGTYTVTITNGEGCDTTITYEVMNTASIGEMGDLLIQIHPNPSNGLMELSFSNVLDNSMQLTVLDAAGRIVIDKLMNMHGSGKRTLDLRELSMGTYVLKLKGDSNSFTTRVVIKH
jgi:subtilisin-like proprotein convertase family protein